MDTDLLLKKFQAIGARALISPPMTRWGSVPAALTLDIARDPKGEYFHLRLDQRQVDRFEVVDARPRDRHLLLLAEVRRFDGVASFDGPQPWRSNVAILPPRATRPAKSRFLCGHDERHWFVAAVPEVAHAANVRTAMEALKPPGVVAAQEKAHLRLDQRLSRKNRAFVRQGEWFFLPRGDLVPPASLVLRNEPMRRSGGKPHWAEFAYREGGETVYVSSKFPRGLTQAEYRAYLAQRSPSETARFQVMRRGASMFVRGRVRHPDHATIVLSYWHEVLMNTESLAEARKDVVFLD